MTNGNASGGTAVVNPSHRALRSASKSKSSPTTADPLEVVLMNEEEKMLDEEVTSIEDNDHEETSELSVEDTMMTVALVKSVVEAHGRGGNDDDDAGGKDNPSEAKEGGRYGLRKRPRAAGQDLARLEHFQTTNEGGLARLAKPLAPTERISPQDAAAAQKNEKPPPSTTARRRGSQTRPPPVVMVPDSQLSSSVPNPLSRAIHPGDPSFGADTVKILDSTAFEQQSLTRVPCPLSGIDESIEKKPMAYSDGGSADRRNVTFNEPLTGVRVRGFSMDIDCKWCMIFLNLLSSLFCHF
jgi:hypothetical protein